MASLQSPGGYKPRVQINPFAFRAYDEKMRSDKAPQYIPPAKRKLIKEYLSKDSVNINTVSDRTKIAESFQSSNQIMLKSPSELKSPF